MGDEERVRTLIEEVLNSGRSPEEVCASDTGLLEEVRNRWLRIRDLAADLEQMFPASGPAWPRRQADPSREPKPLPRIPGYELNAMIGHGGMGVVYRATHLKLSRTVAVKMLLGGDYAPAKDLGRLLREARTVAALCHPHIVEVFDAGEVDGLPYFTMELVAGGSLADKLAGGVPMLPRDAAALLETLAAAVQVAHEKGVVHRDLKPGNVLLTLDGVPKITDFGLARRLGADSVAMTDAARFGTPSYMAPEQALGASEAFASPVDVYALGAILYETLTGRPPFRANSAVETQRQVIAEDPVAPSRINPQIPRDLETICLKCLQKRPPSRYATAADLRDDLRRHLAGEPICARKIGPLVRGLKWARRHPTTTTVVGFATLVAGAVILALVTQLATAAASRRVVESDLEEVEQAHHASDWTRAKSALDRASLRLGSNGPGDLRSRLQAAQRDDEVVKRLEAIRLTRALGSGSAAAFAKSDQDYADAYRDACGVTGTDSPEEAARRIRASTISAALTAAMYDWHILSVDESRRAWMLAILRINDTDDGGWRDRSRDPAVEKDRDAVARLVDAFSVAGQSQEYLLWFSVLVKNAGLDPTPILRKVQSAHPDGFWTNYYLAFTLHERGQTAEALRFIQAAIAVRPDVAIAHCNLGNYLRALNRPDESLEKLEAAFRLDPGSAVIRGNLAHTLLMLGRPTEALPHLELGVEQWPKYAPFRVHLGQILLALERDDDAVEQFQQAVALGARSVATRENLLMGLVLARRGPEAVALLRSSIPPDSRRYEQWDGLAELSLFAGATDEYRATRKVLLDTFGASRDAIVCEKLCRACMLAPIPDDQALVANAAIDRALSAAETKPTWHRPYLKLAKAMAELRCGRPDAAIRLIDDEVDTTLEPMPQLVTALAFFDLGRKDEALAALGRAATLGDWRPIAASARESWVCHVLRREAESKLLPNAGALARGTYWPTTAAERLALLATSEEKDLSFATARLLTETFANDPAIEKRIKLQCRYRAAVAAARCGCGLSPDGGALTAEERCRWRSQSLKWLCDELAALPNGTIKEDRAALLSKWRTDRDLRGVRDPALLANLPEAERRAFAALWADVDATLRASR